MVQITIQIDGKEFTNEESALKFVRQMFAIKKNKQMSALEHALEEIKSFKKTDAVSLKEALTRVGN